jgi:hypothetical protein
MNFRILIFLLFFGPVVYAQSTITNTAPQINSNNNVMQSESIQEQAIDTVSFKNELEKREESIQQKKQTEKLKDLNTTSTYGYTVETTQQLQQVSGLFTATRQQASTQRTQRTPNAAQQQQMNQYVELLSQAAPESFEFHYYTYIAGNYNLALIDHLLKAETLRPDNSDVHIQLAAFHLISQNFEEAKKYLKKLHANGRINENMVLYGKDVLRSVPENGCAITHGFEDNFGTVYAQLLMNERTDITIVSLDFLQSESYRSTLKNKEFTLPNSTTIDVAYLTNFCALNSAKKLGISLTVPKEYLIPIQQNLYVAGLIMEYHPDGCTGNFERNEDLWNNTLSVSIVKNGRDKARSLSANYLPMLLLLRNEYQSRGQQEEVKKIDAALDQIAVQCGKYEQVQSIKASY